MPINNRYLFTPPFNSNTFNQVLWADLPINLDISPFTGDLMKVINVDAVDQSIRNIINTYMFERPYNSIGTSLQLRLFSNNTDLEIQMIKNAVFISLQQNEPRIKVAAVDIIVSPDEYSYEMTITYVIINIKQQQQIKIILERSR